MKKLLFCFLCWMCAIVSFAGTPYYISDGWYNISLSKDQFLHLHVAGNNENVHLGIGCYCVFIHNVEGNKYEIQSYWNRNQLLTVQSSQANYASPVWSLPRSGSVCSMWYFEREGSDIIIKSASNPKFVLDVPGNDSHHWCELKLWEYNGCEAQRWKITRHLLEGRYIMRLSGNGMRYSIDLNNPSPDKQVVISQLGLTSVYLRYINGDYYQILSSDSKWALDIFHTEIYNGNRVTMWQPYDGISQQWFLSNIDGYYVVRSRKDYSYCIDVPGFRVGYGPKAGVVITNYSGGNHQFWEFRPK